MLKLHTQVTRKLAEKEIHLTYQPLTFINASLLHTSLSHRRSLSHWAALRAQPQAPSRSTVAPTLVKASTTVKSVCRMTWYQAHHVQVTRRCSSQIGEDMTCSPRTRSLSRLTSITMIMVSSRDKTYWCETRSSHRRTRQLLILRRRAIGSWCSSQCRTVHSICRSTSMNGPECWISRTSRPSSTTCATCRLWGRDSTSHSKDTRWMSSSGLPWISCSTCQLSSRRNRTRLQLTSQWKGSSKKWAWSQRGRFKTASHADLIYLSTRKSCSSLTESRWSTLSSETCLKSKASDPSSSWTTTRSPCLNRNSVTT